MEKAKENKIYTYFYNKSKNVHNTSTTNNQNNIKNSTQFMLRYDKTE